VVRSTVLVWVVLVGALVLDIMLIVHLLRIITSLSLGLLLVEPVLTLRLGQLVYLRTSESGEEFFGKGMRDWLAYTNSQSIVETFIS
jgi:hypothetical protein